MAAPALKFLYENDNKKQPLKFVIYCIGTGTVPTVLYYTGTVLHLQASLISSDYPVKVIYVTGTQFFITTFL